MKTSKWIGPLLAWLAAGFMLIPPALAGANGREPADVAKPAIPQGTPVVPPPYLLAAEDGISISVINFSNLSTQLIVPPDGKITVPLLEPISVTGKTTEQVAELLTEKWRKFVINPSVTVSLTSKRHESILFYGFCAKTGPMEYRPDLHLITALAEAGGPSPLGDLSRVTITHKSGLKQTLDLTHPETKTGTESDLVLDVGDIVFIPERRNLILITGEVNAPGPIEHREGMTVLEALKTAGGIHMETADLGGATLTHAGKSSPLDLDALLRKGDLNVNATLQPGDSITVPEIRNRTYVFGAVGRAGFYNFKPGDRLLDALTGVGGPQQQADLGKVHIIHINKEKAVTGVEQVDLNKFLKDKKADLKYNVALGPGDVVFVPDRKKGFSLNDLFGILTGASLLRNASALFTGH
jgi:polysaccharide export outer membrane protein